MGYETITVEHLDGVARVTLDRPDRLNALSGPMFLELERFTQEVDQSSDTRVVVVTGRGRAFCSGADLRSYTDEVDMADPQIRDRMRMIARVVRAWRHLDVPTIAAVNGVAYGGGANLALMCDLVIMHEDATIAQSYVCAPEWCPTWRRRTSCHGWSARRARPSCCSSETPSAPAKPNGSGWSTVRCPGTASTARCARCTTARCRAAEITRAHSDRSAPGSTLRSRRHAGMGGDRDRHGDVHR
jgi:hypothetical protein